VWIQSARTPAAVTANENAIRFVCDGSSDTISRSAWLVSSRWVSASSMSARPALYMRAPTYSVSPSIAIATRTGCDGVP
jgi:hypothetical protein